MKLSVSHLLLNLAALAVFSFCFYYEANLFENADVPDTQRKATLQKLRAKHGGHWKFLTVWALFVHCINYALATLLVFFSGHGHSTKSLISRTSDACFFGLSLPSSFIVCLLFWSLFHIDRELVFPVGYSDFYPDWLNHGVHSLPVVVNIVSVCVTRRRVTARATAFTLLLAFVLGYMAWTTYLGLVHDYWVYGVMKVLSWTGRICFMSSSCLMAAIFSEIGRAFNNSLWSSTSTESRALKSKIN